MIKNRDEIKKEAQQEVIVDLLNLCGELPVKMGLPRHLLAIDLHNYAKSKGIDITSEECKYCFLAPCECP